ncbi:ATP-binding protein [Myxosarcina sp. GI1]|uniref:ATP-binding protein n=1 Tax=Myxosarcina sp. GI1 TaxID=1541065 RepID=UPI00055C7676|nr:ATP-binding protein [Myxosarcina sp. GI1]
MSFDSGSQFLAATTDVSIKSADLTNCDREPIHIPSSIQPHGVLLAVSASEYKILQVSLNTKQILGIEATSLLDKPLQELLGTEIVEKIKHCLSKAFELVNPLPIEFDRNGSTVTFDGIVHQNGEIVIVELEPSAATIPSDSKESFQCVRIGEDSSATQPRQKVDFFNFYKLVKKPIERIQNTNTLDELCNAIVEEVKKITEFDRVMVYRFNDEGAGAVVAEAAEEGLEPFLGLYYPTTDIPRQAKYLYTLNFIRTIPDANYESVPIIPEFNPLTDEPLDMSMSVLRSVSPLHTEYLNNMGVAASMSVSLIKNKQLWGLIACHHNRPKKLSYEIRTVCEFIGRIVSIELSAKEENQDLDYKMKLKSIQSQFIETISHASDLKTGLTPNHDRLLNLVGASGAALFLGEEIILIGNTPNEAAIAAMLPWLETQFGNEVIYETNSLALAYPAAEGFKEVASGLLGLLISRVQKTLIIWFRPEVLQTVTWAGNPNKPVEIDRTGTLRLSPRKSFAKWQETVKLKSLSWKVCEIEAALELRSSIVSIILRKADELSQVNRELARSNTELDSFAYIASHDLKEPLRGIYNYSSFLIEDYGDTLDEEGIDKLNTLMRLTHRMENLIDSLLQYSRLGRTELQIRSVNLNVLVAGVLDLLKISKRDKQVEFNIPRPLPTVNCDRTQVSELFTNLISNGIKYNKNTKKIIEIGYLDEDDAIVSEKMQEYSNRFELPTIFYVRDNGIGIREKHLDTIFRIFKRLHGQNKYGGGTGAGLTITKKIVERHGGEIWVKSVYEKGSTFYFTLQQ